MAVLQSTYGTAQAKGYPGMPATMSGYRHDTKLCETAAGIGFGLAVQQGAGDRGALVGAGAAAGDFIGITIRDVTLIHNADADVDKYLETENMAVMVEGDIWVTAIAAVDAGDPVRANPTTGTLGVADGAGVITLSNARWMTSAGIGELGIVRLGGPSPGAVTAP